MLIDTIFAYRITLFFFTFFILMKILLIHSWLLYGVAEWAAHGADFETEITSLNIHSWTFFIFRKKCG